MLFRSIYTRFIIPPFIKFTIGDVYKNQPAVIKSVGIAIPDNTSWELLSEEKEEDWTYLNGKIKWEKSKGKYAQFPRECELNVQMDLLEKERPVVGGSQFGNFWRTLDDKGNYFNGIDLNKQDGESVSKVDSFSYNLLDIVKPKPPTGV